MKLEKRHCKNKFCKGTFKVMETSPNYYCSKFCQSCEKDRASTIKALNKIPNDVGGDSPLEEYSVSVSQEPRKNTRKKR